MTAIPSEPIVFFVEADGPGRDAQVSLLQSAGFQTEAYASSDELLSNSTIERPGCIVIDVGQCGSAGFDLQERLHSLPSAPPIVMLSQDGDVATAVRAMGNGAFDFMQRPVEDELLIERVRAALALDRERRAERALHADLRKRLARLSKREREVLEIVVAGHSNRVVAERLGISTKTIEVHRAHAMKKMEARNLAGLVKMAVALQVTSSTPE